VNENINTHHRITKNIPVLAMLKNQNASNVIYAIRTNSVSAAA
jgi:hypothetical protein